MAFKHGSICFLAMLMCCASPLTVLAQVPDVVDIGKIHQDNARASTDVIQPTLSASPKIMVPSSRAPAGAAQITFKLSGITLEGNKTLLADDIAPILNARRNQKVPLTYIYDVAKQLTKLYRQKGFGLTQVVVPPQEIDKGAVRLQAIEGYIDGFDIKGNLPAHMRGWVAAYAQNIVSERPANIKNIERYVLLMNKLPGLSVRSVLSASQKNTGAAHLTLFAQQNDLDIATTIDNFGNSYIGHERAMVQINKHSLLGGADSWQFAGMAAPDHGEMQYFSGGFSHPLNSLGTALNIQLGHTATQPTLPNSLGGTLEPQGEATNFSTTITHPVILTRAWQLNAGGTLDVTKNKTDYAAGFGALETEDKQSVLRSFADLAFADRFNGYNTTMLEVSRGLSLFGASDKGDTQLSRSAGNPQFTKINLDMGRTQKVSEAFSVLFAVQTQWSATPLLSSEEFSVGGSNFGRAYDSSEISGDSGVAGKIELRYNTSLPEQTLLQDLQLYGFYDVGATWNHDPNVTDPVKHSAASAGMGVRANLTPSLYLDSYVAKPLTKGIGSRVLDDDKAVRFRFKVTKLF